MSKVLLISSNLFKSPYPVYPLGMAVISSALSKRGHIVHQFDLILEDKAEAPLQEKLRGFSPEFIGISIRNIDNVDSLSHDAAWCLDNEKRLISLIRQHTDVPIIVGGSAFSTLPDEILDYIGADYGVIGEGEQILCDLIDVLNSGQTAPRILGQSDHLLMGEGMCAPLWEKRFIEYYIGQSGMINLQTKRGCPYNCSYCIYPCLEGKRFRYRESKAIIDDLERLQSQYSVDTVFFTDSVFNDPDEYYLALAEEIILSGLNIRWAGYFRPKGIGSKELALLKRSGLYAMEVGTDAGCDRTLSSLQKGFTFDDVLDFHFCSKKEEIPCAYFFIFGGPGETEKTVDEGLKNIKMLDRSVIFIYSGARILPGTDLYHRALKEGVLSEQRSLLRPVFYFSPDLDIHTMNRTIESVSKRHRGFIFPPEKGQMMIDAMNVLGHKGLLWDKLVSFSDEKGRRKRKI